MASINPFYSEPSCGPCSPSFWLLSPPTDGEPGSSEDLGILKVLTQCAYFIEVLDLGLPDIHISRPWG
jgi:hypothetical protein